MWFKNIRAYRLTKEFKLQADELSERLAEFLYTPCAKSEPMRQGWVAPLGRHSEQLVHAAHGHLLVCLKRQEKVLPAAAVNELVEEKVAAIERAEARHIGAKERRALKEETVIDLLPRALARSQTIRAIIAPRQGWLVVDSASAKRAEDLLNLLRESVGTLPVIPFAAKNIPTQTMTQWLQAGAAPAPFEFGDECELESAAEAGSVVRCKRQDLTAAEIAQHVASGMFVRKLGLERHESVSFVLDHELACKRLRFAEQLMERAGERTTDNPAEEMDQIFALMTLELTSLLTDLQAAFGGEPAR